MRPAVIDDPLVLDANAVAGDLREIMGVEVTTYVARCANCGNRGALGTLRAWTHGPGGWCCAASSAARSSSAGCAIRMGLASTCAGLPSCSPASWRETDRAMLDQPIGWFTRAARRA